MQLSTTSRHKSPTATHSHSAVPLAVYRKLAAELQTAEAMLESLNTHNQHLAKQNQQLRQEIDRAVQSVLHLQQIADASAANQTYGYYPINSRPESSNLVTGSSAQSGSYRPSVQPSVLRGPTPFPFKKPKSIWSGKISTTAEAGKYHRRSQLNGAVEASGWGLAVAIMLVVLTAFGAGYVIVRPLMPSR